ncbi:MAG: serine protease [Patescibacteria group bacterium]|nr:serine protease [Patescibacteria group bacterium]MDD4304336.1 serine protease [Patescibacteria group bacterium]MDD4695599.1 serine protease [Patescibacteria group bacterium]
MKKVKFFVIFPILMISLFISLKSIKAEEYITDPSELPKQDAFKAIVQIHTFYNDESNYLTKYGSGSGIIINKNGLILTNYHVIMPLDNFDGTEIDTSYQICISQEIGIEPECKYSAKFIAGNENLDIALLQLEQIENLSTINQNFPYLNLNETDTTNINDEVIALGYPAIGGNTITITKGIISGKETKYNNNWIKTDAIISFGNSGGAAIDENGNVIGITSEVGSDTVGSLGYIINIISLNSWINENKNTVPKTNNLLDKTKDLIKKQNILKTSNSFINTSNPYIVIAKPDDWKFLFEQENMVAIYNENDEDSGMLILQISNYPYLLDLDSIVSIYKNTITIPTAINFNKIEDITINGRQGKKLLISSMDVMQNIYLLPVQNRLVEVTYNYGTDDKDKTIIDNMINSLITRDSSLAFLETYEYVNENPIFSIKTTNNLPIQLLNSKSNPIKILNKTDKDFFVNISIEKTDDNTKNFNNDEYLTYVQQILQTANQMGSYFDFENKLITSNAHYNLNKELTDVVMIEYEINKVTTNSKIIHTLEYLIKTENEYIDISLSFYGNDASKINKAKTEFNEMLKTFSLTNIPNDSEPTNTNTETNNNTDTYNNKIYDKNLSNRLKGELLLQVEDGGRIWYVNPKNGKRYEVTFANALNLFETLALGINNNDLAQIPVYTDNFTTATGNRLKGQLLLQVEDKGRIWYVDMEGKRHEVTWANLMDLFTSLSLGITNANLDKIEKN